MIVEIIDKIGGKPIRVEASQLVVLGEVSGNALMIAGEYGPAGTIKVAHAGDPDFNQVLRAFGYDRHQVVVDRLVPNPPPRGAKLLAGPGLE